MITRLQWEQIRAVIRLEMRKTFFARRGLWVYLLALGPLVLFAGHAATAKYRQESMVRLSRQNKKPLTAADLAAIQEGMSRSEVEQRLGEPPVYFEHPGRKHKDDDDAGTEISVRTDIYSDGRSEYRYRFEDNKVVSVGVRSGCDFGQDMLIYATAFQFFYLRLAIFFGCLGIFMNLFRGEMLDKSLHFYLLAPLRRETLLAGKYLAGLIASVVIFTGSTALQLLALGLHLDSNAVSNYLYHNHGFAHVFAYLGVSALACVGYGSVFLAAGLLFRNPVFSAVSILLWEGINPFLPALLKKFSIVYYLKSLCPVNVPLEGNTPALLALLVSNPDPIAAPIAVTGLLAVAALLLALSVRSVRRLEINYSTE